MIVYKCPKCKDDNEIYAAGVVSTAIDMDINNGGPRYSDWEDALMTDPEWNDSSYAWCECCDWHGVVADLVRVEMEERN